MNKAGEFMYLLSLYFDEFHTQILQNYVDLIEQKTNNRYMKEHCIPIHLTLATLRDGDMTQLYSELDSMISQIQANTLELVAIGSFGKHTLYIMPVLNQYLFELSVHLNQLIDQIDDNRLRNRYRPYSWIPHITMARKLNSKQLSIAFDTLSDCFEPMTIKVTKIALSKSHPYHDIATWCLK